MSKSWRFIIRVKEGPFGFADDKNTQVVGLILLKSVMLNIKILNHQNITNI